ncbi:unnamed protein product, partial [Tilletia laevis]
YELTTFPLSDPELHPQHIKMSPLAVTEDTLWGISKLEGGSNYHEWSYDTEMVLRGKNLWTIVENPSHSPTRSQPPPSATSRRARASPSPS